MLGGNLLLVVLLGQAPTTATDPVELVSRLGAARFADREAASTALERLGASAMPALRAARHSNDPEVRNRASVVLQKIEGSLLTEPSRIRMNFEHAALSDVVKSIGKQAGIQVVLYPENLAKWKYAKVSVRESQPVTFWRAIDLISEAAQIQHNPQMHGIAGPREPTFALIDNPSGFTTPNSDHGPFRTSLLGIHYQRDLNYTATGLGGIPGPLPPVAPPRPEPMVAGGPAHGRVNAVATEQFTVFLMVAAEPRLSITQNGALQLVEAVDELGHSLIPPAGTATTMSRSSGYLSVLNGSVLHLQAPLHRPAEPGSTIKKLKGSIPLSISSRRPDPLVVPLNQGVGKRNANADAEVTVHSIRDVPNLPQKLLELSIRSADRGGSSDRAESDPFGDVYRSDTHRLQLEIVDSRGRLVSWFPSALDSDTSRLTLTLTNVPSQTMLKELRYYTLTRTTADLPFAFSDIPMP